MILLSLTNINAQIISTQSIDQNDTLIFDLSQAVCSSGQITFPVYFNSDDSIYAVDFSLKLNPAELSFQNMTNLQSGLVTSAYFHNPDSTLRFTSYSSVPMNNNSPLVSLQFKLPSANISLAKFDSVFTLLNGDNCNHKFIDPLITSAINLIGSPVINPGDSATLIVASQPGLSYLWSTGHTSNQITAYQPGMYYVTVSAVAGCNAVGQFLLQSPSPLPVELLYFKGKETASGIHLEWATASELQNDFFTIYKLLAEGTWNELVRINGAGYTNSLNKYVWVDETPMNGENIYRIDQTDYNGHSEVLEHVSVLFHANLKDKISIYPNPVVVSANHAVIVSFSCIDQFISAEIYNMDGRKIYEHIYEPMYLGVEECTLTLNINSILNQGCYFVNLKGLNGYIGTILYVLK